MWSQLTDRLTLVLHDGVDTDDPELQRVRAAGIQVVDRRAQRVVTGDHGHVVAVELDGGDLLTADAVAVTTRFRVRAQPFASLRPATVAHPSGLGDVLETGPSGETTVGGLYAAGNLTDPSQQVLHAAADGARVGGMVAISLATEDLDHPAGSSATETDWDSRHHGDRTWSGSPNGPMVDEVTELPTGRALDIGAGEGGDAIWLSEQGWDVVASDISQHALDHVTALAADRGVHVEGLHADAVDRAPYELGAYDLVTAHYLPIPRSPDLRAARNIADAVAPGGTLLFVGHATQPHRDPPQDHTHRPVFDPHAFTRTDDIAAVLAESSNWDIEIHEKRPRPHTPTSPHRNDIVLRARRHPT